MFERWFGIEMEMERWEKIEDELNAFESAASIHFLLNVPFFLYPNFSLSLSLSLLLSVSPLWFTARTDFDWLQKQLSATLFLKSPQKGKNKIELT